MARLKLRAGLLGAGLLLGACGGLEAPVPPSASMDFASPEAYAAPFPGDHLLTDAGVVDLSSFPDPGGSRMVGAVLELLHLHATSFGTTSGVFFRMTTALDVQSLPDLHASVEAGSGVVWLAVEPGSSDHLRRYPVDVHFEPEAGSFGAPNLLGVLPLQGLPMAPHRLHAVALTRALRTADGAPLQRSVQMEQIAAGQTPAGLSAAAFDHYRRAFDALVESGIAADDIVALSALTTEDPTAELRALTDQARTLPTLAPVTAWAQTDLFDDYCVYQSELEMPVFQTGEPPYSDTGGEIVFDPAGTSVDHVERARLVVTIPRRPMPASGWPTAVMVRTGGGGDRPLVDRGPRAEPGGEAIAPGTGPALLFAKAGWAGVSVDGPHGGLRNITHADEQFLIFNFANPVAMRDNLRQSALELALLPDVLASLMLDVADCPPPASGPGPGSSARFDDDRLTLMGHSMGATIAPLTLAIEPRYRAAILSGAGGSWIENVIYKESPLPVKPLAEILIGYPPRGLELTEHDPFLNLLQWAGEPADPPVYAWRLVHDAASPRGPIHVLMLQGIVDTYILPPIANATSLSLGLDLAGGSLDAAEPRLSRFRPLEELLAYRGRRALSLPASGNATTTAVVVQHAEDGIEDGHEVMFQTDGARHQVRCFLESYLAGTPVVVPDGGALDPCPE